MDIQERSRSRPGFHDRPVRGLSFAIAVLGCFCFGLGVATLTYSLVVKCKYRYIRYNDDSYDRKQEWNYDYGYEGLTTILRTTSTTTTTTPFFYDQCHYFRTYSSAGIWSGLLFVVSGVIGALASRRKTTCYIVSMMVLSIVTAWMAVAGTTIAIFSNFDESFNYEYDIENVGGYPLELLIPNCIVALFCFVVFILSWINFGFACSAVCCNGQAGLPTMKERNAYQYQTLQNAPPPMMYTSQQMTTQEGGVGPAAPVFQPFPHPQPVAPEPVYLVHGHKVIGMLPQNPQFSVMGNSTVQFNPATATSPVPSQQV